MYLLRYAVVKELTRSLSFHSHPALLFTGYIVLYFLALGCIITRHNRQFVGRDTIPIAVVLDHCQESLDWLEPHLGDLCRGKTAWFYIYERCGDNKAVERLTAKYPICKFIQINLKEAKQPMYTYLHHILNSPEKFHNVNYFLQVIIKFL